MPIIAICQKSRVRIAETQVKSLVIRQKSRKFLLPELQFLRKTRLYLLGSVEIR